MEKNKNNHNKKGKEECPLCQVSEETLEKLKKEKPQKKPELEEKTKKKSFWKFWVGGLILALVFGGLVFLLEQSAGENQASIFGIVSGGGIEIGDLAPDFVSEDIDGNKISLSGFQGEKPVLLVFWATWCGYCAKELPDLKSFTQEHQDEIQVIVISSGEVRETIKDYIQEKDINFLMLLDEQRAIWNQYLVRGTPSHFLVDKEGKIVTLRPGLASRDNLEIMLTML